MTIERRGKRGRRSASSADPFDWGAPNLSFSSFTSLRDMNPAMRTDRTISIGDTIVKTRGTADAALRRRLPRAFTPTAAPTPTRAAAYVFTGLYTGSDFADFLLGLPQQATRAVRSRARAVPIALVRICSSRTTGAPPTS